MCFSIKAGMWVWGRLWQSGVGGDWRDAASLGGLPRMHSASWPYPPTWRGRLWSHDLLQWDLWALALRILKLNTWTKQHNAIRCNSKKSNPLKFESTPLTVSERCWFSSVVFFGCVGFCDYPHITLFQSKSTAIRMLFIQVCSLMASWSSVGSWGLSSSLLNNQYCQLKSIWCDSGRNHVHDAVIN